MQKQKSFLNFTKMASSALGPRLDLGSDVSSNYKDYDTIVNDIPDSEDFGKPKKPDYKKLLIDRSIYLCSCSCLFFTEIQVWIIQMIMFIN